MDFIKQEDNPVIKTEFIKCEPEDTSDENHLNVQMDPMAMLVTDCKIEVDSDNEEGDLAGEDVKYDEGMDNNDEEFQFNENYDPLEIQFTENKGENKYECNECDYKARGAGERGKKFNLNHHVKTVHLGLRFHCEFCSFKAVNKSNLSRHVKAIHEGRAFSRIFKGG